MNSNVTEVPVMLWTAAYSVALLRRQTDPVAGISDRKLEFLEGLASEEMARLAEVYIYGA